MRLFIRLLIILISTIGVTAFSQTTTELSQKLKTVQFEKATIAVSVANVMRDDYKPPGYNAIILKSIKKSAEFYSSECRKVAFTTFCLDKKTSLTHYRRPRDGLRNAYSV